MVKHHKRYFLPELKASFHHRYTMCACGLRGYDSKKHAKQATNTMQSRRNYYTCPDSELWHVRAN